MCVLICRTVCAATQNQTWEITLSNTQECPQAFVVHFFSTGSMKSFDMNSATHAAEERGMQGKPPTESETS